MCFFMSVLKNGMYCSLYEVVEKARIGSNMESLLQKLDKEKLVSKKVLKYSFENIIVDYINISVYFLCLKVISLCCLGTYFFEGLVNGIVFLICFSSYWYMKKQLVFNVDFMCVYMISFYRG